jgi:ornithine lipid ester-linked acyl 2-hydroxylase
LVLENIIARYSAIGNDFFFDANYFDWSSKLEANWQTIRKELDVVLESTDRLPNFHDISPDQYRLSNDGLWKTFFLYGYGIKIDSSRQ